LLSGFLLRSPLDGSLLGDDTYDEDIKDISVTWSSSLLEDTIVTAYKKDGSEFEV